MTATTAEPDSPSAASPRRSPGYAPPRSRSQIANVRPAVRRVSSPLNAEAVTSRCRKPARSRCWGPCSLAPRSKQLPLAGEANDQVKGGDPRRGGERGSPYGPAPGGQSGSVTQEILRAAVQSYQSVGGERGLDFLTLP